MLLNGAPLRRLSDRNSISRLWLCQELLLAPEAVLVCGKHCADWREFFFLVEAIGEFDGTLPTLQSRLRRSARIVRLFGLCHMSLSPTWKNAVEIGDLREPQTE